MVAVLVLELACSKNAISCSFDFLINFISNFILKIRIPFGSWKTWEPLNSFGSSKSTLLFEITFRPTKSSGSSNNFESSNTILPLENCFESDKLARKYPDLAKFDTPDQDLFVDLFFHSRFVRTLYACSCLAFQCIDKCCWKNFDC